ncbi:ATP-binding protein [uncultured Fluviicola sp.]|uniref:sensor histidine kinase n=1 Tax=uncultured Fluviicola sp. TaxID=463303 RepID=UPI0025F5175C|nr:ATP-binding protein [uncultured Fluviicola sp.]
MQSDLTIVLIGTTAMVLVVVSLFVFTFLYQRKMRKRRNELREIEKLLKAEELHAAYALLEGQDKERERIAQDLHDRLGGQLSTVQIYLDLLEKSPITPEQEALLEILQREMKTSIQEMRAIAHNLGNSTLSYYGLSKALEHLCRVISDSKKIDMACYITLESTITQELAKDVYQMIQELITNTLRHAHASKIRLEVTGIQEELTIIYEDNGAGFDPGQVSPGMGLKSIQTRCQKHQGTFHMESLNKGATFIIEIPLHGDS